MTTTERRRDDLHHRLDDVLGPDHATTLMDHLPTVPWRDLATREDVQRLRSEMEVRFDQMDLRLERIVNRLDHLDDRQDHLDSRLDHLDRRFDQQDERFRGLHGAIESSQTLLRSEVVSMGASLSSDLMRQLLVIHAATVALIAAVFFGGTALVG
ncbi:MAG: hypothetical protein KDA97_06235 [Acidimicrobiales bacterium]|nr:hypothetical protein [Acidimicrobiales bacterium]